MKKLLFIALTAVMVSPSIPVYSETSNDLKTITAESTGYNLQNQFVLKNPVSTAANAVDSMNVYTSLNPKLSQLSNFGDGSIEKPYNRFEDAMARVADGGTIYIVGDGAFLNDANELGQLPFLIDKNITIKPAEGQRNATLSVRTAGILLGADVKFENITLSFSNKYHDSIYANGHRLDLINVTHPNGSREIDLFAGGLYAISNELNVSLSVYPSGTKGIINIETNERFSHDSYLSKFRNIYAGSMNGPFNTSAEIRVSNNLSYNKFKIGEIKASGALEADPGHMFDLREPAPPVENPISFPTKGDVSIQLNNIQLGIDGTTGSTGKTSVTTSSIYPSDISLKNIHHLTIEKGNVAAVYNEASKTIIPNVSLHNGATLDLSKASKEFNVENYTGAGNVTLSIDGKLNITNSMNGSLNIQTAGAFNGTSGMVTPNHIYLTTPNYNAGVTFKPNSSQQHLQLNNSPTDSFVEWKIGEIKETTALTPLKAFNIRMSDAFTVKAFNQLAISQADGKTYYQPVVIPFRVDVDDANAWVDLLDYPLQIVVNGKTAEYREDEDGFAGLHYFVEDLELAISFNSEEYLYDHGLTILGYTKNNELVPIKEGHYEISVSHLKEDGDVADFTSYLTVTKSIEQNKANKSSIHFGDIANTSIESTVDIPVSITHDLNVAPTQQAKVSVYVNGKEIAEKDATTSQQSNVIFENIAVNEENYFKVGQNTITVVYSGTDYVDGSIASHFIEVGEAIQTPPTPGREEPIDPVDPPVSGGEVPVDSVDPPGGEEPVNPPASDGGEEPLDPPASVGEEPVNPPASDGGEEPLDPPASVGGESLDPPVSVGGEVIQPTPPTTGETTPSNTVPPTSGGIVPSIPTPPIAGQSELIMPNTPEAEQAVKEVIGLTSNIKFLSKDFAIQAKKLLDQLQRFGNLKEQLLLPETLQKMKEIEENFEKMNNLSFENSTEWEHKQAVKTPNKSWTVKLSKAVKNNKQNLQYITIVDMFGNPVDVTIKIDGKKIIVTPKGDYVSDIPYTLVIKKGLESKDGLKLKQGTHLSFTFK